MSNFMDLAGQRFGMLLVLHTVGKNRFGNTIWQCRCDCGTEVAVLAGNLRKGNSTSCGCARRVTCAKRLTTHGLDGTPEHGVWLGMIRRCVDQRRPEYPRYGGRGITVCDRWRHGEGGKTGLECFVADVGPRPSPTHSIDRYPNNDGNYEPGNVRWAVAEDQANNRRSTKLITIGGRSQSLARWVREVGGNYNSINNHIDRGMPPAKALGIHSDVRLVFCEHCGSEGRILSFEWPNPLWSFDPVEHDHGPCPDCDGTGAAFVDVFPVSLEDLDTIQHA